MPASTFSAEKVARVRAIALITSFCECNRQEDLDNEYGEAFFEILDEITEDPEPDAVQKTVIALVAFVSGMLAHLDFDLDPSDIIPGLAHELYGRSA